MTPHPEKSNEIGAGMTSTEQSDSLFKELVAAAVKKGYYVQIRVWNGEMLVVGDTVVDPHRAAGALESAIRTVGR